MKLTNLNKVENLIAANNIPAIARELRELITNEVKPGWRENLKKLHSLVFMLECGQTPAAPFTVIAESNSKLGDDFLTYSQLIGGDHCPGAGDCLKWCYSKKAHRYPAAWCRQAQNAILARSDTGRGVITAALDNALNQRKFNDKKVTFRLFVDGDFHSADAVLFWMDTIRDRPKIEAYGYSKSFTELLAANVVLDMTNKQWPDNYILNLSDGHKHGPAMVGYVEKLPIARGRFITVKMPYKVTSTMHNDRDHKIKLRDVYGAKAFTCPGKCGDCTPKGHACGSSRFNDVDIIIAVH
jgi:hypothetical protein